MPLRSGIAALAFIATLAAAGCASVGQPRVSGEVQSALGYDELARVRGGAGLSAAVPDPALEKAAAQQAAFMAQAGRMEHTTGRGRDFQSRMDAAGIATASAENIAHAARVEQVFDLWAKSPPHRRNMLDPRFAHFGLASAPDGRGKRYWALVLGR